MQVLADNVTQDVSTAKHGYVPKGTNVGNFLKDDGTWGAPAGTGDVTSAANMTDHTLIRGDGGVKGVQDSGITIDDSDNVASVGTLSCGAITTSGTVDGIDIATDVAANTLKDTNVSTTLSVGTNNTTELSITSDGGADDVTIPIATTAVAGVLNSAMFDQLALAVTHYGDNTQAHSDYLLNSGADIAVGPLTITADNSSADQAYVPMVLYNTDATPPAASGYPVGTLYVQYTA